MWLYQCDKNFCHLQKSKCAPWQNKVAKAGSIFYLTLNKASINCQRLFKFSHLGDILPKSGHTGIGQSKFSTKFISWFCFLCVWTPPHDVSTCNTLTPSVARFFEILPLRQYFKNIWHYFNGLLSIGQSFQSTLAHFLHFGKFSLV